LIIDVDTFRVVARLVKQGARKLGVRHSSLSEWTRNKDRKLST